MPTVFKYRYVDFGTAFSSVPGKRSADDSQANSAVLYENELVLDVGGICWGYANESQSVIDHHFSREGQFPSASAAILHKARQIREKFRETLFDVIWLVSHRQPDFDAFCSMYLARSLISSPQSVADYEPLGLHPEAWIEMPLQEGQAGARKIDWFNPDLRAVPPCERWRVLLAANASFVDNGRPLHCAKNRTLHSILYAALKRGRDYLDVSSGAVEFFNRVREAIESKGLNPLFDSVLEGDPTFAPELALLDCELDAYQRDLQRARKALVHLQKSTRAFPEFSAELKSTPLLASDLSPKEEHLDPFNHTRSQADGIYIRDPECLLFKEWARLDMENSSMGAGFMFTAVAYSNGRPGALINTTDYFFAIDPERAQGRHLYDVWARLQSLEVNALRQTALGRQLQMAEERARSTSKRTQCRIGFEDRAGDYKALFDDPWFDGSNYFYTIVATPNRGTLIGAPGIRGDLLGDSVAEIVRRQLEYSVYASKVELIDFPASGGSDPLPPMTLDIADPSKSPPTAHPGYFRFGKITLHEGVDLTVGGMARQVGGDLWPLLNPNAREGVPSDFTERHLFFTPDWLGVWSRRGVMVAFKQSAGERALDLEQGFQKLADLARRAELFIHSEMVPSANLADVVSEGNELMRDVALRSHDMALPDNRLLSRFFEAIQLDPVLAKVRQVNVAAADRLRNEKLDAQTAEFTRNTATVAEVQSKVEWLEVLFLGFYSIEFVNVVLEHWHERFTVSIIGGVGILFLLMIYFGLKPYEKYVSNPLKRIFWFLIVIMALAGVLSFLGPEWITSPSCGK